MVVDSRNTMSVIAPRCSGLATIVINVPGRFFFIWIAE